MPLKTFEADRSFLLFIAMVAEGRNMKRLFGIR